MILKQVFASLQKRNLRGRLHRHRIVETLEVRSLLTAAPFQQLSLYATTNMPEATPAFTYQAADWDGNSITDVMLVQSSDTASGKVEVSVYSTQYSSFDAKNGGQANSYTALLPVAMNTVNSDWEFRIDNWGGGSKPDLFAIHKANTASGFVEVTIFTGETNFTTSTPVFQTPLPTAGRDWTFDVGSYNNDAFVDLFAVQRNGAYSTVLTVLSGAGSIPTASFSTVLIQTPTALQSTDSSWDYVATDIGNDSVPDLLAIRKYGSSSRQAEISVLTAASDSSGDGPFHWFSNRMTLPQVPSTRNNWSYDALYFNSPFNPANDGVVDLVAIQRIPGGPPDLRFLSGVTSPTTSSIGGYSVPASAFFTTAAQTTSGLFGSYVDSSLRSVISQADWRTTQTIAGTRNDSQINFTSNSLGARSTVNITGGSDANWDNFSAQWDCYISIPTDNVHLQINSNNGSRLWIDVNGDGQFSSSGSEYLNNGWGKGQDATLSAPSVSLKKGVYNVRMQVEESVGPNAIQLLWDYDPTQVPTSAYFTDARKANPGIVGSYVNSTLRNAPLETDWRQSNSIQIAGRRTDTAINFPLNTFGVRSDVGLTSGIDANWEQFSVQWDGYVVIPANGVRLFTNSDDGSRLFIDVNGDGVFSNTTTELLNNGWGNGQAVTLSGGSVPLAARTYRIRMQYEEGGEVNLAELRWDYNPTPVSASVIIGVTSASDQRPTISWSPAAGAAGYDIWVNNITTNKTAVVRLTTGDTWLTPTMDLGIGQFAVWVRSIKLDGTMSAWSPSYNFSINTPPVINPVTLLQPTARPTITWTGPLGTDHYDVWIDNVSTNQSQYVRLTNVAGTSWTPTTDLPMGRYRIWVRSIDAKGIPSLWSARADFNVASSPTPLSPITPTFEKAPVLTWTAVSGAVSYQIVVRNSTGGGTVYNVGNIAATSWPVPANLPVGSYTWWAAARGPDGIVSATPQQVTFFVGGRPNVLGPSGTITNIQPQFSWTPVTGAATYNLWVNRIASTTTVALRVNDLTDTNYTSTTSFPKGTYRVWVQAVSTTGEISPWSAPIDFTIAATAQDQNGQLLDNVFASLTLKWLDVETFPVSRSEEIPLAPEPVSNSDAAISDDETTDEQL